MCSHYQALKEQDKYRRYFGVEPPVDLYKLDLRPGYQDWLETSAEHSMKFMRAYSAESLQAIRAKLAAI